MSTTLKITLMVLAGELVIAPFVIWLFWSGWWRRTGSLWPKKFWRR